MFNTTYRHKPGSTPGRWFPRLSQSDAGAVEVGTRCYRARTFRRQAWNSRTVSLAVNHHHGGCNDGTFGTDKKTA